MFLGRILRVDKLVGLVLEPGVVVPMVSASRIKLQGVLSLELLLKENIQLGTKRKGKNEGLRVIVIFNLQELKRGKRFFPFAWIQVSLCTRGGEIQQVW